MEIDKLFLLALALLLFGAFWNYSRYHDPQRVLGPVNISNQTGGSWYDYVYYPWSNWTNWNNPFYTYPNYGYGTDYGYYGYVDGNTRGPYSFYNQAANSSGRRWFGGRGGRYW